MSAMIVPNEWEVVEIQKLVKITTGNKDTQDSNKYGLYPFFVRSQTIERINSYSFDGEAILTAGDGVGVGKVFHHVNGKFDFHQRVYCLSHFDQNVDPKFLFEYFKTNFIKQVNKYSAKGSVDSVRFDMIAKMLMPLPPKSEQQKIATILSTLDRTIEAMQKLIDKEKMVKKGLMADLLTHGIDEQGRIRSSQTHTYVDSPLGMIPEGWEVKNFSNTGIQLIDGDRGSNYPSENDFSDSGYCLFLSAKNVTKNGFKFEITQFITQEKDLQLSKGKLQKGDIVLTTRGTVGNLAFYNDEISFQNIRINSGMLILRNTKDISTLFLYQQLKSFILNKQIERIVFGSAQPQLTVKEVNKLWVYIPNILEQQKIATILSAQDRKIETEEINLAKLQNLKKGLMGDLLSGKVRVKV